MTTPQRIQRKPSHGWRTPPHTVLVTRPSRWGNPYIVGRDGAAEECVALCIAKYEHDAGYRARCRRELACKDLACFCTPGAPCHADVLLQWANAPESCLRQQESTKVAVPYILDADADRLLMEILAEQVREHGLYCLLDIPGVREPLVRWFTDEIRTRYERSQPTPPCMAPTP